MGDRANVKVRDPRRECADSAVFLYTHWDGRNLANVVRAALVKKWRWNDGAYLARIVFDQMTDGSHGEETGYGISTGLCDNGHPIITLCPDTESVWLENEDGTDIDGTKKTFQEFIDMPEVSEWYQVDFKRVD